MTQFCAPTNVSLLNPNEFRFFIHRAPYLSFFTQTVMLPSITLPSADTENPFVTVPTPGDHIHFAPLDVEFIVDEDLKGYLEMYNWIRGLGFPTTFDEYVKAVADMRNGNRWEVTTSDASVFTNTGSRNVNIEFTFRDAFPVSVSAPTLSTTNIDQPVVTSRVQFAYTYFDVAPVKTS